jgi:hypothetical protein
MNDDAILKYFNRASTAPSQDSQNESGQAVESVGA